MYRTCCNSAYVIIIITRVPTYISYIPITSRLYTSTRVLKYIYIYMLAIWVNTG